MNQGKRIGQGNTAEVYDWGSDSVLKLYREGLPDILCHNEFLYTEIAYKLTEYVPRPIEITNVEGRIGAIYEKLTGKTMLHEMLAKLWRSGRYAKEFAHYHILIHKEVEQGLPSVKEKIHTDITRVNTLLASEKQFLFDYLDNLPDGNMLCHFDFHPDNVILDKGKHYVIDWMTACSGDKLSDIARTGIILKFAQIPRVPTIVNYIVTIFQRRIYKKYIREYIKTTHASIDDIQKWEVVIAAARLGEWLPDKEALALLSFVKQGISTLSSEYK